MNRATSPTGWVRNPDGTLGYTWNPITGCLNNCPYCYARKLANTRLRERYLANDNIVRGYVQARGALKEGAIIPSQDPFYPRFWEDRLLSSFNHDVIAGKEKGIFVCDMSDLFGIGIPYEWQEKVFRVIHLFPEHRFYLLTKQPQNLIKFSPFPDNCWVGVSVVNSERAREATRELSFIDARVKFLSCEPLFDYGKRNDWGFLYQAGINWVIIGSQTKPYKPPKIEWVKEIVQACDKAGIPVFLKENLSDLIPVNSPLRYGAAGELRLRQELPQ